MPFTVLRIQKLKTWGDIAGAGKHNQRERETPNADTARTTANQHLVGTPGMDNVATVKQVIGTQRVRKNAVLGVEMLLSASPAYFRPENPGMAGTYDTTRLQNWKEATMSWLNEKYGNRIVSAILHVDEATPHIHALLVPLDDKGKLNCRSLFGGTRHTLSRLQTKYGEAVSSLGIDRGVENSRATHQKVSQFYTLTQGQVAPEVPLAQKYTPLQMPGKVARMSDDSLKNYARNAAVSGAKAQQEAVSELVSAVHNKNAMLEREVLRLKQANSKLAQEKTELQKRMDVLRGVEPGAVLSRMFNAKGPYKKEGQQYFILPDKREVSVNDSRWNVDGRRGKGAIDLVMTLRGYGQHEMRKVVGELAHVFDNERVVGEVAGKAFDEAAFTVKNAAKELAPQKRDNAVQEKGMGR